MTSRSWVAVAALTGSLIALPALAETPAVLKDGAPAAYAADLPARSDTAPATRAIVKRAFRPAVSGPHRLAVADGRDIVRTRYAVLMLLGVGY